MDKCNIWIQPSGCLYSLRQVLLHRLVITSVHEQQFFGGSISQSTFQLFLPEFAGLFLLHGDFHAIVVPVGKQDAEKPASVRGLPVHLRISGFVFAGSCLIVKTNRLHSPAENHRFHTGLF